MAEFVESLNSSLRHSSLAFMDQNLDIVSHFDGLNGSVMDVNPNMSLIAFANDNFFGFPFLENPSNSPPLDCPKPTCDRNPLPIATSGEQSSGDRKRKAAAASETLSGVSWASTVESKKKKSSGKRGKWSSKQEVEKPKEVVHVRARRGQATDSHSLAERVRRERINEKMRCLQGLVPGCYKTMGMAGMLDEIINYVQSLQNQVEFLSMKLTAASSFYDFNLDMDDHQATQQVLPRVDNGYEAEEIERLMTMMREGYGGGTSFHSTTMPF